jgi:hypothetical protein
MEAIIIGFPVALKVLLMALTATMVIVIPILISPRLGFLFDIILILIGLAYIIGIGGKIHI